MEQRSKKSGKERDTAETYTQDTTYKPLVPDICTNPHTATQRNSACQLPRGRHVPRQQSTAPLTPQHRTPTLPHRAVRSSCTQQHVRLHRVRALLTDCPGPRCATAGGPAQQQSLGALYGCVLQRRPVTRRAVWLHVGLSYEPGLHKQVLKQVHHVANHQRVTVHRPAIWQLDRPAHHQQQHQHKDSHSMGQRK